MAPAESSAAESADTEERSGADDDPPQGAPANAEGRAPRAAGPRRRRGPDGGISRERLLYFLLVPAIVVAVLVLGAFALQTNLRLEQARRQSVLDITANLGSQLANLLDTQILSQDAVVVALASTSDPTSLQQRWLTTAARETPTVRAIFVLDLSDDARDVVASASRAPSLDDDTFRRLLVHRFFYEMKIDGTPDEVRHLHEVVDDAEYLVSYTEHVDAGRRTLIVAWHDIDRIVKETMPTIYRDPEHGEAPMNVVDDKGRIVFGPPINVGEFGLSIPFPETLNKWRLQLALASTDAIRISREAARWRLIQLGMVAIAALVVFIGLFVVITASIRERRLSELKSDFVANVSHELKTPLALIRMFGELLLTRRVREEKKREQYYQIIVSESERLTALIENVLDFARVERGKVSYDFVLADVGPVVARALEIYRYRAETDGVALALSIDASLPFARIDARAIELSVMNLLDNALKYAKSGGSVEVTVRAEDDAIVVCVADHGQGIAADEHDRIFERFYRGTGKETSSTRGSGIGLALVKHIVESHGGVVAVRSPTDADGRGTRFSLHLPRPPSSHESNA